MLPTLFPWNYFNAEITIQAKAHRCRCKRETPGVLNWKSVINQTKGRNALRQQV